MSKSNTSVVLPIIPLFSFFVLVVLWESLVYLLDIQSWFLPAPSVIIKSLWQSRWILVHHAVVTTGEAFIGLATGACIAVILATVMYFAPLIKKSLYPFVIISQTVPYIALAPLLVVWFGIGIMSKVAIITLVCFFPILVNLIDGFAQVDRSVLKNLQVLGASKTQVFRFGVLPASAPYFFSGFRIAGSYAILTAVIAEWVGAREGLGVFLIRAARSYAIDRVFAAVIIISAVSLVVVYIIDQLYTFATPWRRNNQKL